MYLVRFALQLSLSWEEGVPGATAGRSGARQGEDPTLSERDCGDDGSRGGDWGEPAGRTNGQGRALCSSRTTVEERK